MAEPPYGIIWNQLEKGQIIPFLGAGASLSGRPAEVQWDAKTATFLPTGGELSRRLAEDSAFPSPDASERSNLPKVASYYTESADRFSLISFLHDLFNRDYQIGAVHRFLADLDLPLLIVTTNYDDLIERAFREKGKPFHLVAYPTDRADLAASILWWKPGATEPEPYPPKSLPLSLTDTTIIYKIHGTIDRTKKWDSYVITEEDYVDFLARMTGQTAIPARFMFEFRQRRFLFLGYGLNDWNLRVMLKNLRADLSVGAQPSPGRSEYELVAENLRSWAIQFKPSELEQWLWRARKVNLYDVDLDTFIAHLRERMGV